ncbi:hypothetical protein [Nocardia brasiliensis]|uniref:hypothetical protein n=1 Tax=Nocardia brasiliensis TaxID=37326 RepID=UPI003CC7C40C
MEVHRFRVIYNTLRPHQALGDRTPKGALQPRSIWLRTRDMRRYGVLLGSSAARPRINWFG